MCDFHEATTTSAQLSRRRMLSSSVGVLTALGLSACVTKSSTTHPAVSATTALNPTVGGNDDSKLEIVLLGTMGGPPIEPDRTGICTAVVVDGYVYVVDCGRSAVTQYVRSGLPQSRLAAIFLTHLHADHIADFYNFFLLGGTVGNSASGERIEDPVRVFGPGRAGGLPQKFGGGESATISESNPTPGTADLVRSLHEAYAYNSNVFMRDSNIRDIRTIMDVSEIDVTSTGADYLNTAPTMDPIKIMEDSRVRVSATLVPHGSCYPAFAYRFDTDYGSVTLSGDTSKSSNLIALATKTDVLIHEAINLEGAEMPPAVFNHLLKSHVAVQDVGAIASEAGAKQLVLSHIGDFVNSPIDSEAWSRWAQRGYSGKVTVGSDLERIKLA